MEPETSGDRPTPMSATIDHLEADHRVTVTQAFTDARGLAVPAGATGVIRLMGLDLKAMEFTIDWELDDKAQTPQRLVFSLNAANGPRNGKMRDYFEKGELTLPPRPPKPPKAEASPEPKTVRRPDQPLDRFGGRQPQEEICLHELEVACDCGPEFHRKVFRAGDLNTAACLRCGAVTVTKQVGDDGRFTGDAWTAYWTVATPQSVVDWLGRFPRVSVDHAGAAWRWPMSASLVRYPTLYYPADTRVADAGELKALEAVLAEAQKPLSRADNLGSACGDIPAPPAGLPEAFRGFAGLQQALALRPGSDLDTLKAHAHLLSWSCELAAALLIRREGAYGITMEWLRSDDEDTFGAGIAMLRDARPLFSGPDDPKLAPELLGLMDGLPLGKLRDVPDRVESWFRFEALLVAIVDLGANSPEMLDGLAALKLKLVKKDPHVVEAIGIVINELNGVDNRPAQYR